VGNSKAKTASTADLSRCRVAYISEIARGSSHIDSALSELSREEAITEVTADFVKAHGRYDLLVFVELVSSALDDRRNSGAAAAMRGRYAVCKPGRQPKAVVA
jgi:hypothetical protein